MWALAPPAWGQAVRRSGRRRARLPGIPACCAVRRQMPTYLTVVLSMGDQYLR